MKLTPIPLVPLLLIATACPSTKQGKTEDTEVDREGYPTQFQTTRLEVRKAWKLPSPQSREITVETETTCCLCGFHFPESGTFLVFAHDSGGTLHVSICSPTRPLDSAGDYLEALDDMVELDDD